LNACNLDNALSQQPPIKGEGDDAKISVDIPVAMLKNALLISLVVFAVNEGRCFSLSSPVAQRASLNSNAQALTAGRSASENSQHIRRTSNSPLLTKLREEILKV